MCDGVLDALLDAVLGHAATGVQARAIPALAAVHELVHGDQLGQAVLVVAPGVAKNVLDDFLLGPRGEAGGQVEPIVGQPPEIALGQIEPGERRATAGPALAVLDLGGGGLVAARPARSLLPSLPAQLHHGGRAALDLAEEPSRSPSSTSLSSARRKVTPACDTFLLVMPASCKQQQKATAISRDCVATWQRCT